MATRFDSVHAGSTTLHRAASAQLCMRQTDCMYSGSVQLVIFLSL